MNNITEKETNEIRFVTKHLDGFGDVVIGAQKKFLIQNGDPYSPDAFGPPRKKIDHFIGIVGGAPLWQPMKAVWRDVEGVGEKESKKHE